MSKLLAAMHTHSQAASIVQLAAVMLAFWPVWCWYCQRLVDRSDEPLGILALFTVSGLAWWRRRRAEEEGDAETHVYAGSPMKYDARVKDLTVATILMLAYCLSCPSSPPLVSAVIAISVTGIFIYRIGALTRPTTGDWLLLLLSLPVVATLEFYFGYPLRVVACQIASTMLNVAGLSVASQGAEILSNNSIVGIDPPCSGVKMLWVSLYLAATMSSIKRLSLVCSLKLFALAVLAAVAANAMRVSSLFYVEAGVVPLSGPWHTFVHSGVGVVAFVATAAVLILGITRVSRGDQPTSHIETSHGANPPVLATVRSRLQFDKWNSGFRQHLMPALFGTFVLLSIVSAAVPIVVKPAAPISISETFQGWPTEFEGLPMKPVQLSPLTARFADGFPGKIGVFSSGDKRIVCRWVTVATRQLHSSSSCYKWSGYEIKWLPELIDQANNKWARFEATKGDEKLLVRERLFDVAGGSWTDVSSWYWSAVLKQSRSPWWCVSVAERIN